MCRKDVSELFYASTAQAETASSEEVKVKKTSIERLPRRRGNYEVEASMSHSWMNVFAPLGRNNILCADSAGNATMYNTVLNTFMSMPTLNSPKGPRYIALSVPHTDVNVDINPEDPSFFTDKFHSEHTNNLYIMDMVPGNGKPCCFEVLARYPHGDLRWHALPPPPFFHNPHYEPPGNVPFAVVDNTWIFMSTSDKTFSFDTVTCLWSQVGDWVMPFHDKAEYVPELGLWLGLLASSPYTLCAVDLLDAGTGSPPTVQHIQLDLDPPEDWPLVNQTLLKVGPGMFCVAKFYNIVCEQDDYDLGVVVFTGVEVVQCADHQRKWRPRRLRAIKHKSQCHLAESIVQLL
ncbi:unnamed protein product [Urochloa decumbens]|uniref:Uncharacterized protein n=1 Tax=Urochloa decumbens TaxID=240449 RepID=A0ABC9DYT3_9POAL